jgi:hypothetical protein
MDTFFDAPQAAVRETAKKKAAQIGEEIAGHKAVADKLRHQVQRELVADDAEFARRFNEARDALNSDDPKIRRDARAAMHQQWRYRIEHMLLMDDQTIRVRLNSNRGRSASVDFIIDHEGIADVIVDGQIMDEST